MSGGRGKSRSRLRTEKSGRVSRILSALKKVDSAPRPGTERELAILFSDIVGSTGYFERHGDAAGLQMVRRHHELFKPIVEAHGGRVVKTIGDGLMAVFETPRGAVDASADMQRCLRTVNAHLSRRERIRVRIGVHYGPVLVDATGDVFGDVVNVAARIQAQAGPEQILIGEPLQRQLADAYPLRSMGMFQLKGKTSRLEVFELPWKPPGRDRSTLRRWGAVAAIAAAAGIAFAAVRYAPHHRLLPAYLAHPAHPALRSSTSAPPEFHERPQHAAPEVHERSPHAESQPHERSPHPTQQVHERSPHPAQQAHDRSPHPAQQAHDRSPHPAQQAHDRSRAAAAEGRLTLVTYPRAELWLGHKHLGRTPVVNLALPAGRHHLRLVGPHHKAHLLSVTVKRGSPVKLRLKLRDLPLARSR